jgi:dihydrofolate reductase
MQLPLTLSAVVFDCGALIMGPATYEAIPGNRRRFDCANIVVSSQVADIGDNVYREIGFIDALRGGVGFAGLFE